MAADIKADFKALEDFVDRQSVTFANGSGTPTALWWGSFPPDKTKVSGESHWQAVVTL